MTGRFDLERGLVLLAVVFLVLSATVVVTASGDVETPDARPPGVDVPAEYDFDLPTEPGVATVNGREYASVQTAIDAAEAGDTVWLSGRFDEQVVVSASNVTLASRPGSMAVIDGPGEDDVLTIDGDHVTIERVWVRDSGYDAEGNDAGIWVNSTGARIVDSRVTAVTFGIWIDGVNGVSLTNNTIVGREEVRPLSYRGNGIQLWRTTNTVVEDNRITDVRDGIYFSWAEGVLARSNVMWDLRYGVHFMYSDNSRLIDNVAFDNDVGYALMISDRLTLINNTAVNNAGTSGHGILLKEIDHTTIQDNHLVGNRNGLFVYNSVNNTIASNLVAGNDVGVQLKAGSGDVQVHGNSFIDNGLPVLAVTSKQVAWNATGRGNYWSGARTVDRDRDGVSEIRYKPTGLVELVIRRHPRAAAFAHSPAFDAVRAAESSFPVVRSPGVVDHYPLADPPHDNWRRYYVRS